MPGETPEKGDTASWNYGGGKPTGEVLEKEPDGELTVQTKKGNTVKRKGDPENPAVKLAHEKNDVVKKQSELTVEEKANGEASNEEEANGDGEDTNTVAKRDRDEDDEGDNDEKIVKKSRGRPKGATKATPVKKTAGTGGQRGRPAKPKPEGAAAAKSDGPKKGRGRPKKDTTAEGKPAKPTRTKASPKSVKAKVGPSGTGVGSRTRSRN